ncbi:hypothetical protein K432DRAFT_429315 [Lepidopterella palustris CBS 459.81]|uniref:BHLH domain-containing protein n=1 Tax=Lepidopterella palustris CBS 459.81 TaxID=1314670 RepID=A0A8E2E1C4_9PEZI|nr:hypothetical protein K432DRAFT_429315 [Lepidopterella palustris CBS 459.81]
MTTDWAHFMPADVIASEMPFCSSLDYHPAGETWDSFSDAYIAQSYNGQPDYSLDDWVVPDFYDRPVPSVEAPASFAPKNHAIFNSTLQSAIPALNPWQMVATSPCGAPLQTFSEGDFTHGLSFSATSSGSSNSSCQSPRDASPTPSLCGDGCQFGIDPRTTSLTSSNSSVDGDSPDDLVEPAPIQAQRKRGRPRIDRSETDPTNYSTVNSSSPKSRVSRRIPHNQVERKYREGLNSGLERLRRIIPTLPQRDSGDLAGFPKPSKATVLASAIDYIKFMEAERERLADENEQLRGMQPVQEADCSTSVKLRNYS